MQTAGIVVAPVTLAGKHVRLEPLEQRHAEWLTRAAREPEIWQWMGSVPATIEQMRAWIDTALDEQAAGVSLPFAIVALDTGEPVGSTRYMDIRVPHRGLEIGWTWLAKDRWRTPINSECKYLLLRHAFEEWGCIRVQLKTNKNNTRSRNAIERIGGQFEGILRQQIILPNGTYRDSAYYSLLNHEWPEAKARLEGIMASYSK